MPWTVHRTCLACGRRYSRLNTEIDACPLCGATTVSELVRHPEWNASNLDGWPEPDFAACALAWEKNLLGTDQLKHLFEGRDDDPR